MPQMLSPIRFTLRALTWLIMLSALTASFEPA